MQTLCTYLPDLPPSGEAERFFFVNDTRTDWCHDHDLDDLHAAFTAEGLPYTVQLRPALPADLGPETSWEDSCLTAADRNPSLCRQ